MFINNKNDIEKIKKVARIFCEGLTECKYKKIFKVFHPEAKSIVLNQKTNELITLTRDHWKEAHETGQCDPNMISSFKIEEIITHGTIGFAHVKIIDEYEDKNVIYTDFLSLIKKEDDWIIVNKIGHGEQQPRMN